MGLAPTVDRTSPNSEHMATTSVDQPYRLSYVALHNLSGFGKGAVERVESVFILDWF
jgi:hypothetical protein